MPRPANRPSQPAGKRGKQRTPAQPSNDEQSGSTGRRTDADLLDQSKDTGQDRYGQSGFGGKRGAKKVSR